MKCLEECKKNNSPCRNKDCRLWVNYKEDLNCVDNTVSKHGPLTLRETAKRLHVSFVRIKQIEDKAMKKLTNFAKKMANE
jgi:hypothetical protein|tara:strand:+ start:27414 stop:27653 length:240 start_codon:yes stop_codon:yes gene_type:complete